MIRLAQKNDCCGCEACVQRCPKHCISFVEDNEGFLYPRVDLSTCIDCHLCEKVCPVINQGAQRRPIRVYAAKNPDENIRLKSSSGGIFTMLAEWVLADGGVVFGARFDDTWSVIHSYTEITEGLSAFRGSKYVQSRIGSSYEEAEQFLREGRKVLFSGTPCQIAGLKRFLGRDYLELLTVDVVCHGVPSPLVWQKYLEEMIYFKIPDKKNMVLPSLNEIPVITDIAFRDKKAGWKKYGFGIRMSTSTVNKNSRLKSGKNPGKTYLYEPSTVNIFMQGFLNNLYLRPSCYACPARSGKSGSDLSIADYWGIGRWMPDFDDDKGVGLVLINSAKGNRIYSLLDIDARETTYAQALVGNPCMEHSVAEPANRELFWKLYNGNLTAVLKQTLPRRPIIRKLKDRIGRIFRKIR